jgi:threonine/homoserine/homoserine lactone efflux protein
MRAYNSVTSVVVALTRRFTTFAIMLTLVVVGFGTVQHASQAAFEVLRVGGTVFMVGFVAWIIWSARAFHARDSSTSERTPPTRGCSWRCWKRSTWFAS